MDELTTNLISAGVLGPIVVVLAGYCRHLVNELKLAHEKRVEDAKIYSASLLDLTNKNHASIDGLASAVRERRP